MLSALLIFNAYERAQARRDAAEAMQYLQHALNKAERELAATVRPVASVAASRAMRVHPLPPGYRCSGGTLLTRQEGGWMNVTARHNHWHCPDQTQANCYPLTPRSVGCVR